MFVENRVKIFLRLCYRHVNRLSHQRVRKAIVFRHDLKSKSENFPTNKPIFLPHKVCGHSRAKYGTRTYVDLSPFRLGRVKSGLPRGSFIARSKPTVPLHVSANILRTENVYIAGRYNKQLCRYEVGFKYF